MDLDEKQELETLKDSLLKAANEVVKLKITTVVGDVTTVKKDDGSIDYSVAGSKTLHTEIDLLQGDIVSMVDQSLLTETFGPVRDLHESREAKGHEIIQANMDTLAALAQTIIDFLRANEDDAS